MKKIALGSICFILILIFCTTLWSDRQDINGMASDLAVKAEDLARSAYDHFKDWNDEISDQEQGVLFKSESFAAACRLFLKLSEESAEYFRGDNLRTNLYNAYSYLARSYRELEEEMRRNLISNRALADIRDNLDRMDREFSRWPSSDNLSYLNSKYVQGNDRAVYLIERMGVGNYIRRPFRNLESLFRFHYQRYPNKDPWKNLAKVPNDTLQKMEEGDPIDLNFNGSLVADQNPRPNRPIYLIRGGKKCPLARAELVEGYGGWKKIYEVPSEVLESYSEGELIQ
jgi:hypothetical protein